jgi:hypothetical protein
MSASQIKLLITALLIALIFVSGYWLSRMGKPYSGLLLTVHKLIALGAGIYLGITVHKINQTDPLSLAQWTALAAMVLFFLVTVVTGGLASVEKTFPAIVARTHHIGPYLTILSSIIFFYLAYSR